MLTNAIKDAQDILMNSQHASKTYAKFGEAYGQILNKGYWYQEYMSNGGSKTLILIVKKVHLILKEKEYQKY